jgi:hypothetical protein
MRYEIKNAILPFTKKSGTSKNAPSKKTIGNERALEIYKKL